MENDKTNKKDSVKGKIILFAIGVLVGAVIATAGFIAYSLTLGTNNNDSFSRQMPSGTPPAMPGGEDFEDGPDGTPPELPSENSNSQSDSN